MDIYDDEPLLQIQKQSTVAKPKPFIAGKTKLTVINKTKAPLKKTNFTVLLELEGNGSKEDTPGVDIVTVLDVSSSMKRDKKMDKMKSATQFSKKKLSSDHRLSVVTFSKKPVGKCPLRQMTEEAQKEIGVLIDGLQTEVGTNIAGGLRMALDVLNKRKLSRGRVAAIMLMSDGDQGSRYEDARNVDVRDFPVFTFGFGKGRDYNPEVLNAVARNSKGGTFSVADIDEISESNNLNIAFAQCLGGLLTVVVQDLKLMVTKAKPDIVINDLSVKHYPKTEDENSQTISFGNLYNREKRSVLVDLTLPAVTNESGYEVLEICYSYVYDGEPFEANPVSVNVFRTGGPVDEEKEKVATEKTRVDTVDKMQKATDLADNGKFGDAQSKLNQAQNSLERAALNFVIEVLKSQVEQLLDLMQKEIYNDKGRHIALAILTSHYLQRAAAIGNIDPTKPGLFDTPGGRALVEGAIDSILNPDKPVLPFRNEDVTIPDPAQNEQPSIVRKLCDFVFDLGTKGYKFMADNASSSRTD